MINFEKDLSPEGKDSKRLMHEKEDEDNIEDWSNSIKQMHFY